MKKADKKIKADRKAVIAKVKRATAPVKKLLAEKEVIDGKAALRDAEQIAAIRNEKPTWARGTVITGVNGGGKQATYRVAKVGGGLVKLVALSTGAEVPMPSWFTVRGFLAKGFTVTTKAAPAATPTVKAARIGRVLPIGNVTREYHGKTYTVEVKADGVHYEGEVYRSLNPIAMKITGQPSINGPRWFGL